MMVSIRSGHSRLNVFVTTNIIALQPLIISNSSFTHVYINKNNYHFIEDYHKYSSRERKEIQQYFSYPGFYQYSFSSGRLSRFLYCITNYQKELEGFSDINFTILRTIRYPTLVIQLIKLESIRKSLLPYTTITNSIVAGINSNLTSILSTDLSILYKKNSYREKIVLSKSLIIPDNPYYGVQSLEFMGNNETSLIFRFKLMNADSEKARIEWDIARMYYAYIDYHLLTDAIDVYFTIQDYSIYTK